MRRNAVNDLQLLRLLTDMSRFHSAYVEHRLLHLGIHAGQGAIIAALGECGPSSQKELAEYRHVSAATISVMLRRMEKNGLISRSLSEDGKCNQITLTDAGLAMYETLNRDSEGEPAKVFAGLSEDELTVAEKVFRTVSENLETMTQ